MKILVCIKEVPDPESPVEIDRDNLWIGESDRIAFRMNRYDEFALEEAVLIKEALGGAVIDAISFGPDRAAATLKRALGKGADNGIHIIDSGHGYRAPHYVASLIAGYAHDKKYDLILTGVMAEDDAQCLVGPYIASILSIPCAVSVVNEEYDPDTGTVTALSEMEGGVSETIRLPLPALLTIQSGINRPRYPSLSNVLRAKTQELIVIRPETKPDHLTERVVSLSYPEASVQGTVLSGTAEEKAEALLAILHEKFLL